MHASIKTAGIIAATGILLGVALSPANATPNTDDISSTVSAGFLTAFATAPDTMTGVTLNGSTSQYSTGTATGWTITNARGTNAAWSLSASATDFTSAAGSVDTTARTLPIGNLIVTPGTVTAGSGSDAAPSTSAVTMSTSAQALVTSPSAGRGTYTLTPGYSLEVPANAFRSNFVGTVGSSDVNPYVSTITFTIA
ncbi:WxL domain-containing protein [Cryobacterium sp. MLB-32]|uniref:WxL domain-containing protein n=1 Tax=Cryobacterium sp. MLB-32 TaxID=1529318 RepID=UPI00068C027C|nr:WxL domain-containing protein [Cryobacterium sp. MLB-32]